MFQARVIGTAGHIDHGKSTLVQALTGIHPDRLPEERARKLTIDLGFAWLTLDDGSPLGIVDVPGHRDFIQNMLAGVGGIDAALLVIAADEGVMPQTREHLNILHLLGIPRALVALTKCDLVDDEEWLTLVQLDIADTLEETALAGAEIYPVSAHTGAGLEQLRVALANLLRELAPVPDRDQPRLPIDRVFTLDGFGTIVTGTLRGGRLRVGEELAIEPGETRARIRALQCYEQPVEEARPGARVAVNLSGLRGESLRRGQVLARRGALPATRLIDVHYQHLPGNPRPLRHNTDVKVFAGAAECGARARLLGAEQLAPGEDGWLQLRLNRPLAIAEGDRYILRIPSPARTIGGGTIVDPQPQRRWKRFASERPAILETRLRGNPSQRLAQRAAHPTPIPITDLRAASGFSADEFETAFAQAEANGEVIQLGENFAQATAPHRQLRREIVALLTDHHARNPMQTGMSQEELRSRLDCSAAALAAILAEMEDEVARAGERVHLVGHEIRFSAEQNARIEQLATAFTHQPSTPPAPREAAALVGEEVWYALLERGDYVLVAPEVAFARAAYEEFCAACLRLIDKGSPLSASALRDHLRTSRKYAIALLEHLDARGVTKRIGDERVRGPRAPE